MKKSKWIGPTVIYVLVNRFGDSWAVGSKEEGQVEEGSLVQGWG